MNNDIIQLDPEGVPLEHYFVDTMYGRAMKLPAGNLILGRKHKKGAINILAQGSMLVKESLQDIGRVITAPYTWVTQPHSQKIIYSLEDIYLINIWTTGTKTVEDAEKEVAFSIEDTLKIFEKETKWL